jgi:hypothetical protein
MIVDDFYYRVPRFRLTLVSKEIYPPHVVSRHIDKYRIFHIDKKNILICHIVSNGHVCVTAITGFSSVTNYGRICMHSDSHMVARWMGGVLLICREY